MVQEREKREQESKAGKSVGKEKEGIHARERAWRGKQVSERERLRETETEKDRERERERDRGKFMYECVRESERVRERARVRE